MKQRINPEQFGGYPLRVLTVMSSKHVDHPTVITLVVRSRELLTVQHDMIGQMLEDVKGANEILRPFALRALPEFYLYDFGF